MKTKWFLAVLVALCVIFVCGAGALATEADGLDGLLQSFLGAENPSAEAGETDPDIDEGYEFGPEEEEIVVDELIEVDDYAVTEGLSEDWLNVLLLGTDARGTNKYSRTDTMIVLSVNAGTGEAKMTSIMRDTWVSLPGHGGAKLNAACVYGGPELTMRTVNENLHLNIEYYALVNMRCLVDIVDELGGIRLEVSNAERRAMNALISSDAGTDDGNRAFATSLVEESGPDVLLNGKQALAYARIRKSDSDYARTERQRKVLATIARQLQQQGLLALTGTITSMLQYVETNLTFDQIMMLAGVGLNMDMDSVAQFRVPADGTYQDGMFGDTWCIKADFEENARQLHAFIYGE